MQRTGFSETLVCIYKITRRHISDDIFMYVYWLHIYKYKGFEWAGAYRKCCPSHQPSGARCTLLLCLHIASWECGMHAMQLPLDFYRRIVMQDKAWKVTHILTVRSLLSYTSHWTYRSSAMQLLKWKIRWVIVFPSNASCILCLLYTLLFYNTTCFGYLVAIFRCVILYKIPRVLMN
jgi:hypothetical protein